MLHSSQVAEVEFKAKSVCVKVLALPWHNEASLCGCTVPCGCQPLVSFYSISIANTVSTSFVFVSSITFKIILVNLQSVI